MERMLCCHWACHWAHTESETPMCVGRRLGVKCLWPGHCTLRPGCSADFQTPWNTSRTPQPNPTTFRKKTSLHAAKYGSTFFFRNQIGTWLKVRKPRPNCPLSSCSTCFQPWLIEICFQMSQTKDLFICCCVASLFQLRQLQVQDTKVRKTHFVDNIPHGKICGTFGPTLNNYPPLYFMFHINFFRDCASNSLENRPTPGFLKINSKRAQKRPMFVACLFCQEYVQVKKVILHLRNILLPGTLHGTAFGIIFGILTPMVVGITWMFVKRYNLHFKSSPFIYITQRKHQIKEVWYFSDVASRMRLFLLILLQTTESYR